jgi:hypothetical protein
MRMKRKFRRSFAAELVAAIESALQAGFEPAEFECAAVEVADLLNESEDPTSPEAVVQAVEKSIGAGLSDAQFAEACTAVANEWRGQAQHRGLAPDAHLEMAYEDSISGPEDL